MISVGLELGGNAVKVAVLDGGRASAKLRAFELRKIDAKKGDTEDDIISVINETLKKVKAPRNAIVISVRAQDCMIREIVVPFKDDDKIRKTVKYQAENYFTSLSIDDLIIDYSKFADVENKSKLLVAGIKKSHVARRLELLEECKVDPVSIDLDVAGLYNTYAHMGVFEDKGAVVLVEIKADTLKIGVVEKSEVGGQEAHRLRLARAVRMRLGSMRLDQVSSPQKRIAAESGIYDTAADESARLPVVILDEGEDEAFSLEDSQISESERSSILQNVFMEIDRTVASVQLQHEVELICLSGPSCRLDGIEQVFSDHFELEARRIDVGGHFGAKKDAADVSLEGGTAVGLALKGLGIDHCGMEFRQEEFGYAGTLGQLKRGLACTLTILFALVFLYAFSLKQELREKNGRLDGVKQMQKNLYTVMFPNLDKPEPPHQPLPDKESKEYAYYLDKKHTELRTKYGGDQTGGPKMSAMEVLKAFGDAKALVKSYKIEVNDAIVDPSKQSRFTCWANDDNASVELGEAFAKNPKFEGRTQNSQPDKKRGGVTFQFFVKVKQQGPPGR